MVDSPSGDRFGISFGLVLRSRAGLEFSLILVFLRLGLSSLTTLQSLTAGAGIELARFLKVDYAFESHPTLSAVHRVSLSFSPWLFSHAPKKKQSKMVFKSQELLQEKDKKGLTRRTTSSK